MEIQQAVQQSCEPGGPVAELVTAIGTALIALVVRAIEKRRMRKKGETEQ